MRLTVGMCSALTEDVMTKLQNSGIRNVTDFMLKDPESLAMESSVSYKDLYSIRQIIRAHYAAFAVSGDDMLEAAIKTAIAITTGNTNLDNLLGGGLMAGEVMEVCGGWGVGKTSLCVNLAVHAALKFGKSVLYIDPLASISALRISSVVEALSEEPELVGQALAHIKIVTPSDVWGVFQALEVARQPHFLTRKKDRGSNGGGESSSIKSMGKTKLVIVDSLPAVILPLLAEPKKQGLGIINQLAVALKSLASEQQLAVVVVNNTCITLADFSGQGAESNSKWKPALGRFWAHVPHIRLYIERETSLHTKQDHQNNSPSPLEVKVTIWKGTRLKEADAKITIFSA
ncbi:DNA repair protein RAD51 homolog 4-like [Homarus americanus]|uniref:DNA repair protein RAD51 homolog 4-like n=1 Tax=Homarus americanus TaxID=6706 RepID=UPI001C486BC2|nr:DNA repair protein RAD51 homolog 4-like [Homarus americanus]